MPLCLFLLRHSPRLAERVIYSVGGFDQVDEKSFIDFEKALVLCRIADCVTSIEHAPNPRVETQCVRKCLKYDKSGFVRAISVPAKGGKCERVGGAVGKVKAAL